ncbi:uncharacterized protein LOC125942684 [Dermacentor silvarum]|uniref:uncharacterized protein LOC125942684 n=1 Tax=Dermacentor silvarum TaxID=543639 RepID=UPI002101CC46|nr:uncharacterized protein LOC125942684 [Dermacentor silvarum]
MPPRVQRFFLRLLRYDYVLTFVPGKQLNLADMLSRSPGPGDGTPVDTTDVDLHAVSMVSSLVSERTSGRLAHVDELRDLSTTSVIDALRAMFARYGLPLQLCTDNGPQFASHEFAQFAARYDFEHSQGACGLAFIFQYGIVSSCDLIFGHLGMKLTVDLRELIRALLGARKESPE